MIVRAHAQLVDAMIGNVIRSRRVAVGLSRNEIAKSLKKSGSYLFLIEEGHLRPDTKELIDLAGFLHCQISEFLIDAIYRVSVDIMSSSAEPEE